jgi:D-alanyl-D-alanine carboxypeptidase/D-alanyl-D-alanine-endopeptidase (penicillin-binding protein 4)
VRVTVGVIAATAAFALAPATAAEREGPVQAAAPGPDLPARSAPALARTAAGGGISRRKLKRRLRKLARKAPGASGFYVYDIGAAKKRVLFDRKEGRRRKLASNTKLFTTATALHRLGDSSRIETTVIQRGAVKDRGRLEGRLYLVGAGDPSLGKGGLRELAREVRRSGIRRVAGKLVADDSVFDRRRGVPDSGFGPSPYVAPLSGLVYGGSTYSADPALAAGAAFKSQLRKRGVKVKGRVRVGKLPKRLRGRPPIAATSSPTIAALAAATNKPSDNFFAEMLLKRLWAQPGRKGTTNGGAKAVERFARRLGSRIDARDGSGLTDGNRSSPRDVVRLLVGMREHLAARAFYRSLPVVGKEGTVDERMEGTAAAGRCRAKTGTISGVSTLSGYCNAGHGEKVAFSLLMNGVSSYDAARNVQDKMVVEIARYRP